MARKALKLCHDVPIFDAHLWIVVADASDLSKERDSMACKFGPSPANDFHALLSYNEFGSFGVFLPRGVKLATIAHEVFHATHRILEWAACNFDSNHHEQGALLCGYLFDVVHQAVAADRTSNRRNTR